MTDAKYSPSSMQHICDRFVETCLTEVSEDSKSSIALTFIVGMAAIIQNLRAAPTPEDLVDAVIKYCAEADEILAVLEAENDD